MSHPAVTMRGQRNIPPENQRVKQCRHVSVVANHRPGALKTCFYIDTNDLVFLQRGVFGFPISPNRPALFRETQTPGATGANAVAERSASAVFVPSGGRVQAGGCFLRGGLPPGTRARCALETAGDWGMLGRVRDFASVGLCSFLSSDLVGRHRWSIRRSVMFTTVVTIRARGHVSERPPHEGWLQQDLGRQSNVPILTQHPLTCPVN